MQRPTSHRGKPGGAIFNRQYWDWESKGSNTGRAATGPPFANHCHRRAGRFAIRRSSFVASSENHLRRRASGCRRSSCGDRSGQVARAASISPIRLARLVAERGRHRKHLRAMPPANAPVRRRESASTSRCATIRCRRMSSADRRTSRSSRRRSGHAEALRRGLLAAGYGLRVCQPGPDNEPSGRVSTQSD